MIKVDHLIASERNADVELSKYLSGIAHEWLKVLTLVPTLGILAFSLVNLLASDRASQGVNANFIWFRGVCVAVTGLQCVVLYRTKPSRFSIIHGYIVSLAIGTCVTAMTVSMGGFSSPYYAGINLALASVSTLVPWRALHSALNGAVVLAVYFAANWIWAPHDAETLHWMLNSAHFTVTMLVILVCANHVRYKLIINEFYNLSRSRAQEKQLAAAYEELRIRDEALQEDLAQAKDFQKNLMTIPSFSQAIAFALKYTPCDVVGGDFLDVWEIDDNHWGVLLVDVAGHGVQACMRAMQLRNHHETLKRAYVTPWHLLKQLNDLVVTTYGELSILYTACAFDLIRRNDSWELRYCNAGQPPLLIFKNGTPQYTPEVGPFQGASVDLDYPQFTLSLSAQDRLFVYTDGCSAETLSVPDTTHVNGEWAQDVSAMVETLVACTEGPTQADDVTLLGMELA